MMALGQFYLLYLCLAALFHHNSMAASVEIGKNRCYSCASENMKDNFLTRSRGPKGRVREPKLYDSMCDLDSWLIREKSAVECQGPCFKWQQVLNNSGVLSYATIRDCFERIFDPAVSPTPSTGPSYTTECKHVESKLECLDQSSIEEHTCYCTGDFCNSAHEIFSKNLFSLFLIVFLQIFYYPLIHRWQHTYTY